MGDSRRFEVMTKFVLRNYPKAKHVLCIADGGGELSEMIAAQGKITSVIDPVYNRKWFSRNSRIHQVDLIVGLHPDEATAEIVIVGEKFNIPYAIVPCCVVGREARNVTGYWAWLNKLSHLAHHKIRNTVLPMGGANIILFK